MNIDKLIAKFKNLEIIDLSTPSSTKKTAFHKRIKNKDNPKYYIDYWHTGKYRAVDGTFQHAGFENKYLRAEIEKLASYTPTTVPTEEINTHGELISFGKHKGERWTRIPVSYLRWLANEFETWRPMAVAELKRRGTTLDQAVEISGHALDRASLNCRRLWYDTSEEGEGLNAWLIRIATEALESKGQKELVRYKGLKMIFTFGEYYPVLKTVMPYKDEVRGKSTLSLSNLLLWLAYRRDLLEAEKEKAPIKDKRHIGSKAVAFKQVIGYIEGHLRGEKDVILSET